MKSNDNLITGGVTARIRSMILASELKPGQRLVEKDFGKLLDVGRTPVREALLLLQGEGYVVRNHRGWEVRSADDLDLQHVFESRAALEGASARLAAEKLTPALEARLAELIELMEPGENIDRLRVNALNEEFHRIVIQAADNELLSGFHERTLFFYWALRTPVIFSNEQLAEANRQHRQLLEALRRGSGEDAECAARLHVEHTTGLIKAFMKATLHYETISRISALESGPGFPAGRY
ncbi:MAG TPA: GntR family transcriptional regulator [Holophaga sp.]|nr:GntR family transcriptional regulator [Holophaga sp.]